MRNSIAGLVGLCLWSLLSKDVYSEGAESGFKANELLRAVSSALSPYGENASFSLRRMNGDELVSIRSAQLFSPASVAKLVSSACTLEELGPDFRFETEWAYRGSLSAEGKLQGDLVLRGSGDFSFVIEDLKMASEKLRHVFGIKEITGKLVFDVSYLGRPSLQIFEGFEGDLGRAFSAPATAAPINHNAFSVWIYPQEPRPRVSVIPHQAIELEVTNRLTMINGRLNGSRTRLDYRPTEAKLILSGQIGRSDQVRAYYRSLVNPYESFARLLKYNLELLGVQWNGEFAFSNSRVNATSLWTHRSTDISRLLVDINKLSTNFGSEMALLAAGANRFGLPASLEKSQRLLSACLSSWSLKDEDFRLENASGLSRSSRVKTSSMTSFLSRMGERDYFPEFLSTLAILGLDGTTRTRLPQHSFKGRLKTGSLANVRSIAGYLEHPTEGRLAMALFLNCTSCDLARWSRIEDQIISRILQSR
ncbi:MAG: D-alanyl-D-alanine carboxypeptidase/D-alanyl-D-alanine-endopeptidase [Bradymonadales bacterium]|nr:MAG: D-alanyl-D-alanine carboxypeptidase/D-alanyl-D-alanine-endopeptidase [Bradymonadales bacterium]